MHGGARELQFRWNWFAAEHRQRHVIVLKEGFRRLDWFPERSTGIGIEWRRDCRRDTVCVSLQLVSNSNFFDEIRREPRACVRIEMFWRERRSADIETLIRFEARIRIRAVVAANSGAPQRAGAAKSAG